MDEQRRAKNREKKSSVNWWKWAFLGLVLVLILFVVQLMGSFQSVSINEPNNNEVTHTDQEMVFTATANREDTDRKSTRLNSSHVAISYAVFCLKKKSN